MGKVRTRILGLEDIEEQQKEEQRKRSAEKKAEKAGSDADVKTESKADTKKAESKAEAATETKGEAKAEKEVKAKKLSKKGKEGGRNPKKGKTHARSKKYKEAAKKVEGDKYYTTGDALALLKKIAYTKQPGSVELHLNVVKTGLKGEIALPHSTGKVVRVQIVDDEVLDAIQQGKINFDVLVAHPSYMPKLARFAKVLGPKGLMPNPKNGTVSPKPEDVVKKFEKGTMQWKTEPKAALIHQMVGKVSLEDKALEENVVAFLQAVGKNQIKAAFIKTTMSPSLKLDLSKME